MSTFLRFNSRTPGGVRLSITDDPENGTRFNSRTPGGVRRSNALTIVYAINVSIHAPREGCDSRDATQRLTRLRFQFTHPGRGATTNGGTSLVSMDGFNSRTPGGVRLSHALSLFAFIVFQFTHPGRGATLLSSQRTHNGRFQFTHPGRGATALGRPLCSYHRGFNSRTPGGVRPPAGAPCRRSYFRFNSRTPGGVRRRRYIRRKTPDWFQFTHPGRGATWRRLFAAKSIHSFNSRTPGGVRRGGGGWIWSGRSFNSRTPGGVRPFSPLLNIDLSGFNSRTPGGVRPPRSCHP